MKLILPPPPWYWEKRQRVNTQRDFLRELSRLDTERAKPVRRPHPGHPFKKDGQTRLGEDLITSLESIMGYRRARGAPGWLWEEPGESFPVPDWAFRAAKRAPISKKTAKLSGLQVR
jgi:hypothetical protein